MTFSTRTPLLAVLENAGVRDGTGEQTARQSAEQGRCHNCPPLYAGRPGAGPTIIAFSTRTPLLAILENAGMRNPLIYNKIPVSGANRAFEQNQRLPHYRFSVFQKWKCRRHIHGHRRGKSGSAAGFRAPSNTDSRRGVLLHPCVRGRHEAARGVRRLISLSFAAAVSLLLLGATAEARHSHRWGGCARAAALGGPCGCRAMQIVGITDTRFWLVRNWFAFRRTSPHVGAAAVMSSV